MPHRHSRHFSIDYPTSTHPNPNSSRAHVSSVAKKRNCSRYLFCLNFNHSMAPMVKRYHSIRRTPCHAVTLDASRKTILLAYYSPSDQKIEGGSDHPLTKLAHEPSLFKTLLYSHEDPVYDTLSPHTINEFNPLSLDFYHNTCWNFNHSRL